MITIHRNPIKTKSKLFLRVLSPLNVLQISKVTKILTNLSTPITALEGNRWPKDTYKLILSMGCERLLYQIRLLPDIKILKEPFTGSWLKNNNRTTTNNYNYFCSLKKKKKEYLGCLSLFSTRDTCFHVSRHKESRQMVWFQWCGSLLKLQKNSTAHNFWNYCVLPS